MEEAKLVTVSGFTFENPTLGEEALKEQEAIEYVNKQLDFNDTNKLLTLYNQMIRRRMFHTQVGFSYLKSIQDYLMKSDVDPQDIEAIPVIIDYNNTSPENDNKDISNNNKNNIDKADIKKVDQSENNKFKNREKRLISKVNKYQKLAVTFIVISVILVATVVFMFVIANTSSNPTILNYEEVLQNKYSAWEQDLQRREREINSLR